MKDWIGSETSHFLAKTTNRRRSFRKRFSYFHAQDVLFLKRLIPADCTVVFIGCQVTSLANALAFPNSSVLELQRDGAVEDASALQHHPSFEALVQTPAPDYVVLPYTFSYLTDIQDFMEHLYRWVNPRTRIIILQYNFLWTPLFKIIEKLALKAPSGGHNWLSRQDIRNLLELTHYQIVTGGAQTLIPIHIPLLSWIANRVFSTFPGFQWLGLRTYSVARPMHKQAAPSLTVSIVVPARNEAGNIQALLDRLPVIGKTCEVIFIEGHSKDNTWEEIQRQVVSHPRRNDFRLLASQQAGVGKADAVEAGFALATGEVLMILDADLSVQPEDLPHFYNALVQGSAEFLNGSRLVYKMEDRAMQILNLFFNKVFGSMVSWLIGQPVKDTLCGTKVLLASDYQLLRSHGKIFWKLDPFGDFRLLFGAGLLGLKIVDVPVRYKERTYGSTNIRRFRNGWQLLTMCLSSWRYLK